MNIWQNIEIHSFSLDLRQFLLLLFECLFYRKQGLIVCVLRKINVRREGGKEGIKSGGVVMVMKL